MTKTKIGKLCISHIAGYVKEMELDLDDGCHVLSYLLYLGVSRFVNAQNPRPATLGVSWHIPNNTKAHFRTDLAFGRKFTYQ